MAEKNSTFDRLGRIFTEIYLNKLADFLETTQFGSITLVIQDGKVIQIEKNEKVRIK